MAQGEARDVQAHRRALIQAAHSAIRDIYDAIIELVTNADDRYQILNTDGSVEIEVERRRGSTPSILRVRDFADGMDGQTMDKSLRWMGGRDSGLDKGESVRGTHSRGAKDVVALGRVTFESIAQDGLYHTCEITPFLKFLGPESREVTRRLRKQLGIPSGTGTLVTISLRRSHKVPHHDTLRDRISRLVSLRGILSDEKRDVVLRDLGQDRVDELKPPSIEGTVRVKERFTVPGYPQAEAKLFINRARHRFERELQRFRPGGILVTSRRAIHEATLFDGHLESDPHALWFYGKLVCPYIDDLCDEFDDRFERELLPSEHNPAYLLDPSRRSGLSDEHPFTRALYAEALKRLRPLVEEERKREEHQRATIESDATRKRLNALEKAALDFMRDFGEDEEIAREPDGKQPESRFMERGYSLSPPFTQIVAGHSRLFWLTVRQETFPEIEVGATVQIECLSRDIEADKRYCGLEPHPAREGVLRALWKVKALTPSAATGLRARVGPITAEAIIEVLGSEADKYRHIEELCFSKKRYQMRTDQKRKEVTVLAPLAFVREPTSLHVEVSSRRFEISGQRTIRPVPELGVAVCKIAVKSYGKEAQATLTARLGEAEATASIASVLPTGAELSIKLEDIDLGNQRYRWRQNVLEIAARHPSLKRYLGDKEDHFPGQETKHFRVLLAEVVADAVCALLVRRNVQASPEEYEDADWDTYYAMYSKYMTQFLPVAHKLQAPEPQ